MNAKPVWPTIESISALIRELKKQIQDDYRAYPCGPGEDEDTVPSMLLTVGADGQGRGSWSWQTGDNSYSGGAYHYAFWGTCAIYRRSNSRGLARDIIRELNDGWPW